MNLFSRRCKSFDHHYPLIVEALAELPEGSVVDGEIVALDESGRPNINLLQSFRSQASHIDYFIFDMLTCDNRDLTRLPLSERRKLMKSALKIRSPRRRIAEQFDVSGRTMLRKASPACPKNVAGLFLVTCDSLIIALRELSFFRPGEKRLPKTI